jgi:hypothetical protein
MAVAWGTATARVRSRVNKATEAVSSSSTPLCCAFPVLEIHVSARNLAKRDIGSPSDAMCVFFIYDRGTWTEFSRTEVCWNNPDPKWVATFKAAYIFEQEQRVRFVVADVDSDRASLKAHDIIGNAETSIQLLVADRGREVSLNLVDDRHSTPRGVLLINLEQQQSSGTFVEGQVSAQNLKKMHTFSRNCPFFQLEKQSESGGTLPCYRSSTLQKCSGGTWPAFSLGFDAIAGNDLQCPVTIRFYDQHSSKAPVEIGSVTESFQIFLGGAGNSFSITQRSSGKITGTARFVRLLMHHRPTFFEYLQSGIQINLVTAIDYTASNGSPDRPNSLHYLSRDAFNQYESCINAVGSVICPYDTDQMFAVYGFGGNVGGRTSHCFPLTFNPEAPCVSGLQGILAAYRSSLSQVTLSGPTLFAPIINASIAIAAESWRVSRTYTVLMIVTDGEICDQAEAIEAIVNASKTALSLIIVGVGSADFTAMNILDGDGSTLKSRMGEIAKRDIVQFVPVSQFTGRYQELAAEVLAEIPNQLHEFCVSIGYRPGA